MKQRLIHFSRYVITFLLLVAFCVGLLFACGLAPQDRVEANYLLSLDEIEPEWSNTNVLRQKLGSYALDDWTEVIILSLSTYMDARSAPDLAPRNRASYNVREKRKRLTKELKEDGKKELHS